MGAPLMTPVGIAAISRGGANIINPMRERHKKDILEGTAYIFNITAISYPPIYRTHGVTIVVGNESRDRIPEELIGKLYGFGETEGVKWCRITVHGRIELVEAGIESSRGVTYREESTEAHEIAQDITNYCNDNRPGNDAGVPGYAGVFWSNQPEPSPKEVREAQKKLFTYYHALVEQADRVHQENVNNPNPLKDRPETMAKVAFRTLKAAGRITGEKAWVYEPVAAPQMAECPVCGAAVPPAALRCKSCLAFLTSDREMLHQYFPNEFPKAPTVEPPKK